MQWLLSDLSVKRVALARQPPATIFEHYVTEGDGLRQAAAERIPVYDVKGANAERQAAQFREVTEEFMTQCPA